MKKFLRQDGQGLAEYSLVLALVAILLVLILIVFGSSVVLAYAKVIGGLSGQTVTGTGPEVVVVGQPYSITPNGNLCAYSFSDPTFIALQDGVVIKNDTVALNVLVNGSSVGSISGTTNNNGIANATGSLSGSAFCPASISYTLTP